jgi:hypothetical protein
MGLATLEEGDQTDDEIRAEAEAAGVDFAAWGAEIKAKADALLRADEERRERERQAREQERMRRAKRRLFVAWAALLVVGVMVAGAGTVMVARGPVTPAPTDKPSGAETPQPPVEPPSRIAKDHRPRAPRLGATSDPEPPAAGADAGPLHR